VDLNRAGTPLLEIVTQPDIAAADEAVAFARELRSICRFLGVTEGIMQRGHMRFEPNVNVAIRTDDGAEHRTPIVEIKNLNSFRAIRDAIEFEHRRQVESWKADGVEHAPGRKSTRGWDDRREATVLQREKEEAHDYRYFPDPDLVPVVVDEAWLEAIRGQLGELPAARRARYLAEYALDDADAWALTEERDVCLFYEACVADAASGRAAAKLLLNTGARLANERSATIDRLGISPGQVAAILDLRRRNLISAAGADQLFALLCDTADDATVVAKGHGLLQVTDEGALDRWVQEALAVQPQAAADYRAGKQAALGRLVGEVMKRSGGKADAKAAREKLEAMLRAERSPT
jgi:aspartyl-tRNA(Asn)/glutamyl-tRNA(Gln) amidotransferase subunit B